MSAVSQLNSRADVLRQAQALSVNANAARGLQDVLKSNLGPSGTLKMLVGGAGQIKVTKDGGVLLSEMQIQHPTAAMIARAASAQDDATGDGTTSHVLLLAELLKLSERYVTEGVHPRQICEGIDLARDALLKFLEEFKIPLTDKDSTTTTPSKDMLVSVARTCLRTKLTGGLADRLGDIVVDAVNIIKEEAGESNSPGEASTVKASTARIDLHRVEMLHMRHKFAEDTCLIRGLALDHGSRHPDMPTKLSKCHILTCNVSLEYEKTEVHSGFFYSSPDERDNLVTAERKVTDEKVQKIIDLKRKVCGGGDTSFVVLNQKGIDPPSLDMLAKENIIALRRVKRRNMERLTLACGGNPVNSVDDLTEEDLGYAEDVYEFLLGEEKFTFVEGCRHPRSCTVLVKAPTDHAINQIKEACRDGLRSVKNVYEDNCLIPGAAAFEIAGYNHLMNVTRKAAEGKAKLGVQAFAESLLIIPKCLAINSGLDPQDVLLRLLDEQEKSGKPVGIDLSTGSPISPQQQGLYDSFCVKKQMIGLAPTLAQQLLLVDEVIRAGKQMRG